MQADEQMYKFTAKSQQSASGTLGMEMPMTVASEDILVLGLHLPRQRCIWKTQTLVEVTVTPTPTQPELGIRVQGRRAQC